MTVRRSFLPDDNFIRANADFRVFTDMADYWADAYKISRGNQAMVDVVHEWFKQALVEAVNGCQALCRANSDAHPTTSTRPLPRKR